MSQMDMAADPAGRLFYLPVSLFSVVMGLAGATIAFDRIEELYAWEMRISPVLLGGSTALYVLIAGLYLTKLIRYPAAVMAEFNHPVRISFFPAMSIGLILLSIGFLSVDPAVSRIFWIVGSVAQLLYTLVILSAWIHHERYQIQHSNPAWFIPIVGNILVPLAGVPLGFIEISWFYFSVGLLMWLPLLAVLFNRLFFYPMVPGKLLPTLFIMIAPPAVGFLSWVKLHGGALDDIGRIFYYFALFTTLLLFFQWRYFVRLPFALSWWAYSFPLAAITVASSVMQQKTGAVFFVFLTSALLVLLVILIVVLLLNTVRAMLRGEVCVPE